jgi:hypothetical protein
LTLDDDAVRTAMTVHGAVVNDSLDDHLVAAAVDKLKPEQSEQQQPQQQHEGVKTDDKDDKGKCINNRVAEGFASKRVADVDLHPSPTSVNQQKKVKR